MFEENEMIFHFRLKKSDKPELYDAIISRPRGQRSHFIRSVLVNNYARTGYDPGLQGLLEKLDERGEYHTELLIGLKSLLNQIRSAGPGPDCPAGKDAVEPGRPVDPGMSQNMVEMYATLNAE